MYNPYESNSEPKITVDYKRTRASSKRRGIGTVNAGGAIIIIIFVVLCLTIFGLLSFATSFADKRLADRTLDNTVRYYNADSEAEEKLALIFDTVYNKIQTTSEFYFDEDFIYSAIKEKDIQGEIFIWDSWDAVNTVTVVYHTEIFENELVRFYLNSEIDLVYNESNHSLSYKIRKWNVVSSMDDDPGYGESGFDIFDPDMFFFG